MSNASIHDVAKYIYEKLDQETITQMKLYKLLWFCQGWHYAARGISLFPEKFVAWTYGPVPMDLWRIYRGNVDLHGFYFAEGDSNKVKRKSKKIVDKVLDHYGHLTDSHLSYLSHKCEPWKNNRNSRPGQTIPNAEIKDYFQSIMLDM